MLRLLIIADDLTGSLDTGVQLAQYGVRTLVTMDTAPGAVRSAADADALVIDTESRHLPPRQASRLVGQVVSQAVECGVPYIYKKTDSALRGNLGAELMAAAAAAGVRPLPFVPAWPENGRTTKDGVHFVDGVPLDQTDFAGDVLNPIVSSRVDEILQSTAPCSAAAVKAGDGQWADADVLVFDAQTGADVDGAAKRLYERGMLRLTAGCARLIQSLAPYVSQGIVPRPRPEAAGPGGVLLACGSLNAASLRQTAYAMERLGYQAVLPDGDPCGTGRTIAGAGDRLVLRSSLAGSFAQVQQYLSAIPRQQRAARALQVAECMGARVKELVDQGRVQTLIVFGGDTLFSVIRRLGITRLEPVRQLAAGVVLCLVGYRGRTLYLVTKAGSFGQEDLVEQIEAGFPGEPCVTDQPASGL